MKRVISRIQMILDLTAPFLEKYVYKDPSQRESWGYTYLSILEGFHNSTLLLSREFMENIFLKRKNETDTKFDIPNREDLP